MWVRLQANYNPSQAMERVDEIQVERLRPESPAAEPVATVNRSSAPRRGRIPIPSGDKGDISGGGPELWSKGWSHGQFRAEPWSIAPRQPVSGSSSLSPNPDPKFQTGRSTPGYSGRLSRFRNRFGTFTGGFRESGASGPKVADLLPAGGNPVSAATSHGHFGSEPWSISDSNGHFADSDGRFPRNGHSESAPEAEDSYCHAVEASLVTHRCQCGQRAPVRRLQATASARSKVARSLTFRRWQHAKWIRSRDSSSGWVSARERAWVMSSGSTGQISITVRYTS